MAAPIADTKVRREAADLVNWRATEGRRALERPLAADILAWVVVEGRLKLKEEEVKKEARPIGLEKLIHSNPGSCYSFQRGRHSQMFKMAGVRQGSAAMIGDRGSDCGEKMSPHVLESCHDIQLQRQPYRVSSNVNYITVRKQGSLPPRLPR